MLEESTHFSPYMWDMNSGTYFDLPQFQPSGGWWYPLSINNSFQVVGNAYNGTYAVLWEKDEPTDSIWDDQNYRVYALDSLLAEPTYLKLKTAIKINDVGQIIGEISSSTNWYVLLPVEGST